MYIQYIKRDICMTYTVQYIQYCVAVHVFHTKVCIQYCMIQQVWHMYCILKSAAHVTWSGTVALLSTVRQHHEHWRPTLQMSFSPLAKKEAKTIPSDLSWTTWGYKDGIQKKMLSCHQADGQQMEGLSLYGCILTCHWSSPFKPLKEKR